MKSSWVKSIYFWGCANHIYFASHSAKYVPCIVHGMVLMSMFVVMNSVFNHKRRILVLFCAFG